MTINKWHPDFLRQARKLISDRGKRMRINLQMDYLRPDPPITRLLAYPANMEIQWRKWVYEGLMDEAVFRFVNFAFDQIIDDPHAADDLHSAPQNLLLIPIGSGGLHNFS